MGDAAPPARLASRLPFYYGWIIAVGGAVNASFVLGSAQFAFQTFLVPMEETLGWSRTVFFGALATRMLLAGMLGPLIGPWADGTKAPRIMMPVGVLFLGASMAAVRWVEHPVAFFLYYGVLGAVGTAILHLQMWEAIMLKWFSKKRTRVLMIGGVGEGTGTFIFPALITFLILTFGWRDAWLWYGGITVVVLMPVALAIRTRPEHVGQHVDGLPPEPERPAAEPHVQARVRPELSFTRPQALRTQGFYMLAVVFTLSGVTITGFQAQWIPHFRDIGIDATPAALAVSVYGLVNIFSRPFWGFVISRFPLQRMMLVHALAATAGVACLRFVVEDELTLFTWAAYQGLVLGSFFSLHTVLAADYFGRPHIGAIRGAMMPPASVSRAGGPLLLAGLRDLRGTYDLAFGVVLAGWGAMLAILALSRKPTGHQR